jgi:hypothetical protein
MDEFSNLICSEEEGCAKKVKRGEKSAEGVKRGAT